MSCDGYCEHGEPVNYGEETGQYEVGNCFLKEQIATLT